MTKKVCKDYVKFGLLLFFMRVGRLVEIISSHRAAWE
jgi:hypothetical protein